MLNNIVGIHCAIELTVLNCLLVHLLCFRRWLPFYTVCCIRAPTRVVHLH
jgi:hypothetical protein